MVRPSGRSEILEAAERVVIRDGAGHLTIDAVAAEAALSKGGVLYHFPNKSALLEAMLVRLLDRYEARRAEVLKTLGTSEQKCALSAELMAGLTDDSAEKERQVGAAILAVLANEPALIDRGRAFHEQRFARCCGGIPFQADRAVALLALDGLKLLELLQLSPFSPSQREAIQKAIQELGDAIVRKDI